MTANAPGNSSHLLDQQQPSNSAEALDDEAELQFAYDEYLASDDEEPPQSEADDDQKAKRRQSERPQRLDYVPYMTLRGHKRGVAAVKYSPDGKWIASCCRSTSLPTGLGCGGELT